MPKALVNEHKSCLTANGWIPDIFKTVDTESRAFQPQRLWAGLSNMAGPSPDSFMEVSAVLRPPVSAPVFPVIREFTRKIAILGLFFGFGRRNFHRNPVG